MPIPKLITSKSGCSEEVSYPRDSSASSSIGNTTTTHSPTTESNSLDPNSESRMPPLSQPLIEPEMISRKSRKEDQEVPDLPIRIAKKRLPRLRFRSRFKLDNIF